MGEFRLWLEASWEKETIELDGEKIPVKDVVSDILSKKFSGRELVRVLNSIGNDRLVRTRSPLVAIPIANWLVNGIIISPEEHDQDWEDYYNLRKKFKKYKSARELPQGYRAKSREIKKLLESSPLDFIKHYSDLQGLLSSLSDLSKERGGRELLAGTEPIGKINADGKEFLLYRIDTPEEAKIHEMAGAPRWCILSSYFGRYGGPPYMPIVSRTGSGKPHYVAMFIPNFIVEDPRQGLRNASNTDMLDLDTIKKIRPLIAPYLAGKKESAVKIIKDALKHADLNHILKLSSIFDINTGDLNGRVIPDDFLKKIFINRSVKSLLNRQGLADNIEEGLKLLGINKEALLKKQLPGIIPQLSRQNFELLKEVFPDSYRKYINDIIKAVFDKLDKMKINVSREEAKDLFSFLVELLKEPGIKHDFIGSSGKFLVLAVHKELSDIVSELLRNGFDPNYQTKGKGLTPLHYALMLGHAAERDKMIQLLLQYGADINLRDKRGQSPIDYATAAAKLGDSRPLELLQSGGSQKNRR